MEIRGDQTDLFSHCIAIGLANILQNEGKRVRLWWSDGCHIRVETDDGMDDCDMGNSAVSYAQNIADSDWLQFEDQWGEEKASDMRKYSPLSPCVLKGGFGNNPKRYGKLRRENLDLALENGLLAQKMFVAIGRPSYWSKRKTWNENQKDGASPWIMFSTSQGADYIRKYYRRICEKIVSFTSGASSERSFGERLCGKEASDDFRGEKNCDKLYTHGLCEPGREVDTLQFWCVLHAFCCFSTRPVVSGRVDIQSPSNCLGCFRHDGKRYFCLPVFNKPVYFERFKSVLRSADLYRFCKEQLGNPELDTSGPTKRLGIQCAYIFERLQNSEMSSNTLHYAASGIRICGGNERG